MPRAILTAALFALLPLTPAAGADKADGPKTDPPGAPLEVTVSGTAKYTLDTGGQTPDEYRKAVATAAKGGKPAPTPAVELTVTVKNTSDKPVTLWTTGDPVVLTLGLKGKGALDLDPPLAFTEEFRAPRGVEIPAGKTTAFKFTTLTSGYRGRAHFAYWTEPGVYELVATLKTGVSPAPKGATEGLDGFGLVTLTSAPFKVTVEAKK